MRARAICSVFRYGTNAQMALGSETDEPAAMAYKIDDFELTFETTGLTENEQALVRAVWIVSLQHVSIIRSSLAPNDPKYLETTLLALRRSFPGRTFEARYVGHLKTGEPKA